MSASEQAEVAVLAVTLATQGKVLDEIRLSPDDFYEPKRGDLFALMVAAHDAEKPVDAFTLTENPTVDAAFVWSLTSAPVAAASAEYYAAIVAKHALRRRLAAAGAALAQAEDTADAAELADRARTIVETAIGNPPQKLRFVKDVLPDVVNRLNSDAVFVPSPWKTLNKAIGGFRPGAVYVIAARPGVGKTVVAAQIAVQLAQHGNVAFSSLEMTDEELVSRFISERLRIGVGKIKDARMTPHDWDVFERGRTTLEGLSIAIDDRSGISTSDVRTFARAVQRHGVLSGIVVDYMQLMSSKQKQDRHLQVAEFSRQLKVMAKDFQVPVIALSQLNRNSESSTLAIPKLSDLRESGAIEQDADVVILLRKEGEVEDIRANVDLVMDVAKNRHGPTGEARLLWDGMYSRAIEYDYTNGETHE
jgi:replicative DNA helicase